MLAGLGGRLCAPPRVGAPRAPARPPRLGATSASVLPSEPEAAPVKKRRGRPPSTRKKAAKAPGSSSDSGAAEAAAAPAPSPGIAAAEAAAGAAPARGGSFERLQGSASDTLRALLERRAARQAEQRAAAAAAAAPAAAAPAAAAPPPEPAETALAAAPPPGALAPALEPAAATRVRFWLTFHAEFGQRVKLVGGPPELGGWDLARAPECAWSEGDNWHATVHLRPGSVAEYKFVLLDHSGQHAIAWQRGNNSVLALRGADDFVEVFDNWGGDPGSKVVADGAPPATREARLLAWASEVEAALAGGRTELRRARLELAAAREDARAAREEARALRARLAAAEAERAEAAGRERRAAAVNGLLHARLADTTASLTEALETAADILRQADDVGAGAPAPPLGGGGANGNGAALKWAAAGGGGAPAAAPAAAAKSAR